MNKTTHHNNYYPDDIFNDALSIKKEDRAQFLNRACSGNKELLLKIENMLAIVEGNPKLLEPPDDIDLPERLGKYKILYKCGSGGMGIVYKAKDMQLGREVAIKLLRQSLAQNMSIRKRFEREACLLASLNDDNIATIYTFEKVDGYYFLTMEFVEGSTLKKVVNTESLSISQKLHYCHQISQALESAHEKRVIHLDLKPTNIMVTNDDRIKVLDFGIAKVLGDSTQFDSPLFSNSQNIHLPAGTPEYMSPEQIIGDKVDHRSDIWAFGCILFESLTGQAAYSSADLKKTNSIVHGVDLSVLPKGTPKSIRNLIGDCLKIDPDQRLKSIRDASHIINSELNKKTQKFRNIMIALMTVIILFAFAQYYANKKRVSTIATLDVISKNIVRGLDAHNNIVWTRNLPCEIKNNIARSSRDYEHTIVKNNSMSYGAIIPTSCNDIYLLDSNDGSILWNRKAEWQVPVNTNGELKYWWTRSFQWIGFDLPIIAASMRDGNWYNFALEFIDFNNSMIGIYYHPGSLYYHDIMDLDNNGNPSVILFGKNSSARFNSEINPFDKEAQLGCVVLLDSLNFVGQAYPFTEGLPVKRDWPDIEHAKEEAYLLIPVIHENMHANIRYLRYRTEADGRRFIWANLVDGRMIELDPHLFPISCYITVNSIADSLNAIGMLPHIPFLHIRAGVQQLVDVPLDF